ncbi:hypothetical protein [Pseudonocardia sp. T1-2H]|uniref:hypothetical protein n=1 Tax=Pseudonocardia sp. T1-2H TaxID=3128899 RepID=UPI003100F4E3
MVSALLAIAAHVAGSGSPPQTASLVIAVVALAAASSAVADRQRGLLGVLALTGAGQLAVHLVLFGLDGHAPDPRGLRAPGAGHPLVMIVVHGPIAPGNASSGRCSAPRPGRPPAESSIPDRPPFANSGVV